MTHYERLGVDPTASPEQLRAAYRALARRLHPDARGGSPSPAMAELNEAWRVLSDPARRAAYDASLAPRRPAAGGTAAADAPIDDRDAPLSDAEARAARRFGMTLVVALVLAAAVLVPLFVYAFVRSASLSP